MTGKSLPNPIIHVDRSLNNRSRNDTRRNRAELSPDVDIIVMKVISPKIQIVNQPNVANRVSVVREDSINASMVVGTIIVADAIIERSGRSHV